MSLCSRRAAPAAAASMQAVAYSAADDEGVRLVQKPKPALDGSSLPKDRVLVRVLACGVNPVDAKYNVGDKLPDFMAPLGRRLVEGRTAGFDFAGRIIALPPGVASGSAFHGLSVGDAVFGTMPPLEGSYAEFLEAPVSQIAKKPEQLSFEEAAVLPLVGLTCLQSLKHDCGLCPGQHLLLIGASGGVGHVAVQLAKAVGARVTAVCSSRNAELVRKLGADSVVDYTKGQEALQTALAKEAADHGPFDLCFDTVTSREGSDADFQYQRLVTALQAAPGVPALRGKYITIGGWLSDWVRAGFKRMLRLPVSWFGQHYHMWVRFPNSSAALQELAAMADGPSRLKPIVAHTLPFGEEGTREAFRLMHSRRVVGKVAMTMPSEKAEGK